jgi:hypothetical protein
VRAKHHHSALHRRALALVSMLSACLDFSVPRDQSGTFAACCGGLGTCVAAGLLDPDQQKNLGRDRCKDDLLCVPRELIERGDRVPASCTAELTGAEGRCLPACVLELPSRSGLQRDDCAEEELCAPCFDPLTGAATAACALGADPGPKEPAVTFDACCGELGRCVPSELLDEVDRPRLVRAECADDRALCVPLSLARDAHWTPQPCSDEVTGAEGRCLPACLLELDARAHVLARAGCGEGELCGPCFDPVDGHNTGACNLGGDPGPTRAPTLFGRCCGSLGRCVPEQFVPEAERARVEQEGCSRPGDRCLPESLLLDPEHVFASCAAYGSGAEGRCLPACLPAVAERKRELAADGCSSGELCTPCYEPIDGQVTGACDLGGDPGPTRAANVFANCCGDVGRCVPSRLVSAGDRDRLTRDSCTDASALCVPAPLARDASYAFATCLVSATGGEGRCLPACLSELSARGSQLRADGCGSGNLCAPCYEPVDGVATGACNLGGDAGPTRPAAIFTECCDGAGRCTPSDLIPADERDRLGRDVCTRGQELCLPAALARDSTHVFSSCVEPTTGAEGRCLPACLPDVAARADQLMRASCDAGELCAPCYDPFEETPTGACSLGADPGPDGSSITYAHCCSEGGRCIPSGQVPANARDKLSADGCTGALLCVPLSLAREPDAAPAVCHDAGTGAEGRCLLECLPQVAPQASRLRQSGCGTAERCAPCYDPTSGEATGACSFAASDPGPTEPPVVFDACCAGGGLCVPGSLLPGGSSNLSAQSCSSGYVCAPRASVVDPSTLSSCFSILGPGVCVDSCFVPNGLSDLLSAVGCADTERCVPCWLATGLCP